MSTLLFNAVLEDVFRDVRSSWVERKFGIQMLIGVSIFLQSLCFADDVLLIAANRHQARVMLEDLKETTVNNLYNSTIVDEIGQYLKVEMSPTDEAHLLAEVSNLF